MPLYEYECGGCGKRFELIQKFSAPPEFACPKCGTEAHRLLSPPALQFKGSGWYITDYARKSRPAEGSDKGEGKAESRESARSGDTRKAPAAAEPGSK
ncbi:MAG: zinc ribbon domain-containing protein [Candidatus Acidoferrales bacterium]